MIDIVKFEQLANEIIANLTKEEMEKWLTEYRANNPSSVSFKHTVGSFKMDFSKINFHTKEPQLPLDKCSWAA